MEIRDQSDPPTLKIDFIVGSLEVSMLWDDAHGQAIQESGKRRVWSQKPVRAVRVAFVQELQQAIENAIMPSF
jgi:hypothetical protein